jgi:hypothetical protein
MSYEDIQDIKGDDKSQYVVIIMERLDEKPDFHWNIK